MRRLLLLLLITLSLSASQAQVFNWARSISGPSDEFASCIAVDDSSNTYVVGYFQTQITFQKASGTIVLTSNGSYDYFISKFDCSGNAVWAVQIGGTGSEKSPYDFGGIVLNTVNNNLQICTSIGGNATAYSANGSSQALTSNAFTRDIVVGSYDLNGNIQWINTYGGTGDDRVEAICNDPSGNILVRGEISNTVSFGSFSLTSAGGQDVFLLKLNASGTPQWVKKEGGTGTEASNNRIMADGLGNIYVQGKTDASLTIGTRTITHTGAWGIYYLKYDALGNLKWVVNSGTTGAMADPSIVVDDAYKVFVAGSFFGTDTIYDATNAKITVTANGANADILVIKLDSNGKFVWWKNGNSTGNELTTNLAIDKKSNLYVSGLYSGSFGFGTFTPISNGSNDGYILVLDSSGTNVAIKSFGSTGDEQSFFTHVDKTGIVYTCGGYNNTVSFGGNSLTAMAGRDAFFAKTKIDSSFTFLPKDTVLCNVSSFTIVPYYVSNVISRKWSTNDTSQTITVNSTGWYKLRLLRNCDSLLDSIYINFIVLIPNAGTDASICKFDSVMLSASGGVSYSWTPTTGLSNPNIANPMASPAVTTSYVVTVSNNICSGKDTVTVNVYNLPVITTNADTTFCKGNSKVLSTSGTSNRWLWNTGDTTSSITVTPLVTTTYWVRGQIGNVPCYSRDSITITVLPIPVITTNNDTTFCSGLSKTLTALGNSTRWLWNTGDTTQTIVVSPSVTTSYWVRGQTGAVPCYSWDTVKITVLPTPTVVINNDTTICWGDGKVLTANGTANHWQWNTGDTTKTITVIPFNPGIWKFWVVGRKDTIPCFASDTITIKVLPIPTISTNKDTIFCQGGSTVLTATGTANRYYWSTGDTTKSITVSPSSSTAYWVRGQVDTIPCFAYDSAWVYIWALPVINNGNDTTFCLGNSKTLTANGTANRYLWSTGDTTKTITVLPPAVGTYKYWVRGKRDTIPCISYDTMSITVLPLPSVFTNNDTTFCQGTSKVLTATGNSNRYLWSTGDTTKSITITPSFTSNIWVRGQNGNIPCFAFDTVKITVLPLPIIVTNNDTTFCLGNSKTLTANGTANRYVWKTGDTTQSITVLPTTPGVYTYWVRGQTSNVPCFSFDTVTITVLPVPTIKINNDTSFCQGITKVLSTSGTSNRYVWSTGDTSATINIKPMATTTYWVRGQSGTIPCYTFDTVVITVIPLPAVDLGNDLILCDGGTTVLTAPIGMKRVWSTGDTSQTITVTIKTDTLTNLPQKFWVRVTGPGPCDNSDTVLIYSYSKPRISSGVALNTICEGSPLTLIANHTPPWTTVRWSTNDSSKVITVVPSRDTIFYVNYTNKDCNFSDTIRIKVLLKPKMTVSPDDTICPGTVKLQARGTKNYQWSTGATDSNITVPITKTTKYWVIGTDGKCFSDTQWVTITVLPKATAAFTANPTTGYIPLTVTFTNTSLNYTGCLWHFGDGDTSTQISPAHIYKKKGNYYAQLIAFDSSGCNDTFQMLIIVDHRFIMILPSVFTPNGDQLNDVFEIEYQAILSMKGQVFSRWGELIYDWEMPDGKWWDGTSHDHEMPSGVYYYVVTVVDEKNITHEYKGAVTLIR